ncbi:MAG: RIP metalloprotease RseP [Fidelibacterota bacterium]
MTTILGIVFVLAGLILIHELGHFLAARSVGVRVDRFSLLFPPRIVSFTPTSSGWVFRAFFFKKGPSGKVEWAPVVEKVISRSLSRPTGTEYSVGLVPLGGYVKMAGTIDESLDDRIQGSPDELSSKTNLQQIWVMSAGVVMNLLLAVVVFSALTLTVGIHEPSDRPTVGQVVPDFPAAQAGIRAGDTVVAVDGTAVESWEQMADIIHDRPLETLVVMWRRGEELMSAEVTTRQDRLPLEGKVVEVGVIGIHPEYKVRTVGLFESVKEGFLRTGAWFGVIVHSLKLIVSGEASIREIGGPILIAQLAGEAAQAGFVDLLFLLAIISVHLAFINLVPIPGLDGGHLLILIVESVSRHRISMKARMIIQQAGMALLFLLVLVVMYNDLTRVGWLP